mmetsp:Transcript_21849/g.65110  ORF Transcript_21849/g.65110 Transcript_21849/m.65110 type:complete len:216 (+) Transcript_21849:475-1122(+)
MRQRRAGGRGQRPHPDASIRRHSMARPASGPSSRPRRRATRIARTRRSGAAVVSSCTGGTRTAACRQRIRWFRLGGSAPRPTRARRSPRPRRRMIFSTAMALRPEESKAMRPGPRATRARPRPQAMQGAGRTGPNSSRGPFSRKVGPSTRTRRCACPGRRPERRRSCSPGLRGRKSQTRSHAPRRRRCARSSACHGGSRCDGIWTSSSTPTARAA